MRRHLVLAAATAGLLVVTGCGSDTSGTPRTVTAVVTVSGGADSSGAAASTGAPACDNTVPASPGPSPAPSSGAPFVAVDPLKVDCGAIIGAADVKKTFGIDIPNDRRKITVAEVNANIGQTGRIRCLYGLSADKNSGVLSLALTQYGDAAAAQKQVEVTVANEKDIGAQITPVTVSGYPATLVLRDGGLIVMSYDTWTMALAITGGDPAAMTVALPLLAQAALARVLKS